MFVVSQDAFGKRKITMTGKMGGAQDDLYVSFGMFFFWAYVHMQRLPRVSSNLLRRDR